MADGEKIYVGNGKKHVFPNGGSEIKIAFKLTGIKELFEKYGFTSQNGDMFIPIILNERREPDQYNNTHYLTINTFKPDPSKKGNSKPAPAQNDSVPPDFPDDIPF